MVDLFSETDLAPEGLCKVQSVKHIMIKWFCNLCLIISTETFASITQQVYDVIVLQESHSLSQPRTCWSGNGEKERTKFFCRI